MEIEEAAWTLGCTRLPAFTKVVLPLILPGITASAIFAFVLSWNGLFAAAVLTIADQEFIVLLGASGCGKTTLLRINCGLETATTGEVWIGGILAALAPIPKDRAAAPATRIEKLGKVCNYLAPSHDPTAPSSTTYGIGVGRFG